MEELDLIELVKLVWKKKFIIIGIMTICIIMAIIYTKVMIVPQYQSTATILFATERSINITETGEIIPRENIINYQLIPTFAQLVKSDEVTKVVSDNLGINFNIKNNITAETKSSVEMLDVSVTNEDPEMACKITKELANVFAEKVKEYYKIENIYIVNEPQVAGGPYNVNLTKNIIVFACIGVIISLVYVLVLNMIVPTEEKKLLK